LYPLTPYYDSHSQPQDPKIQHHVPVVHVPDIQLEPLFPIEPVPAVDLSPTGNARPYLMAAALKIVVAQQVLRQERPRPHDTHIASQNIPELRQFVQAGPSQEAAQTREAFGIRQEHAVLISVLGHGSKLQNREFLASRSDPPLPEDAWLCAEDIDRCCDQTHDGHQCDQRDERKSEIESSL